MLTEFLRPGPPSIGGHCSIVRQSLLYDVIPDREASCNVRLCSVKDLGL